MLIMRLMLIRVVLLVTRRRMVLMMRGRMLTKLLLRRMLIRIMMVLLRRLRSMVVVWMHFREGNGSGRGARRHETSARVGDLGSGPTLAGLPR